MKFETVRKMVEEHLVSINENTYEIQSLFDYLNELEVKYEKLSQRLDSLQLTDTNHRVEIKSLNEIEKKIFLILYTEEDSLTHHEIAKKAQLTLPVVQEALSSLSVKGVPLHRCHFNQQLLWKIEPQFKEIQAKQNLVNLSLHNFMENNDTI